MFTTSLIVLFSVAMSTKTESYDAIRGSANQTDSAYYEVSSVITGMYFVL